MHGKAAAATVGTECQNHAQGEPLIYFVFAAQDPDESAMRVLMRVLLLAFPGFNDHLPCDYERALREACLG